MGNRYDRWWRRTGKKKPFRYTDAQGRRITDARKLERLEALRIPPAWREVRISPSPRAKLQAVGFDEKGRRQYLYHADWVAAQAAQKYDKLVRFVRQLPHFREVTTAHLSEPGLGKQKVLALVTRLINEGCFRVGGERYARENHSFGIATLMRTHLHVGGSYVRFTYTGKRGIRQSKVIPDPEMVALICEVKALRGRRLFKYRKEDGTIGLVTGREVNAYIKAIMGPEFSAKDFRTWGGTLLAARVLAGYGPAETATRRKQVIRRTVAAVANFLGNTPAIARASYISPRVFERYEEGVTIKDFLPRGKRRVALRQAGYTDEEIEIMRMLCIECEPDPRVTITRQAAPVTASEEAGA